MVYSESTEEYNKNHALLKEKAPEKRFVYYKKNWDKINSEWVLCYMKHKNVGSFTNNRIESVNSKIRGIIKTKKTKHEFIVDIFVWLHLTNFETDYKVCYQHLKVPVFKSTERTLLEYRKFVTKEAYEMIEKQYHDYSLLPSFNLSNEVTNCILFKENEVDISVTTEL